MQESDYTSDEKATFDLLTLNALFDRFLSLKIVIVPQNTSLPPPVENPTYVTISAFEGGS
jgi:hypothetical protein